MSRSTERILAWLRAVAFARSERTLEVPGGVALLNATFPAAHDHNRLLLWSDVDADTAAVAANATLGGAGLTHRVIDVQSGSLADRLEAGLAQHGYSRSDELIMTYAGAASAPKDTIVDLDIEERADVAAQTWSAEQPDWPAAVSRQLGDRVQTLASAVDSTFLAVRDESGVAARADLYTRDRIAQIEDVFTAPNARGQGFASALVTEAARRARRDGADLVFLIVDSDGPVELYRRLGFTDLHTTASFTT